MCKCVSTFTSNKLKIQSNFQYQGATSTASGISSFREISSHPTDARWSQIAPARTVGSAPVPREGFASILFEYGREVKMNSPTETPSATAQFKVSRFWVIAGKTSAGEILDDLWYLLNF